MPPIVKPPAKFPAAEPAPSKPENPKSAPMTVGVTMAGVDYTFTVSPEAAREIIAFAHHPKMMLCFRDVAAGVVVIMGTGMFVQVSEEDFALLKIRSSTLPDPK